MSLTWGTITWLGDSGSPPDNLSPVLVRLCTSTQTLYDFMLAMEAKTLCTYKDLSIVTSFSWEKSPPGAGANVDKKAIIYYRDPDTLEVLKFMYPSPIAADIEETAVGLRIKDSAVATIVGFINTMTGKTYIPLYGKFLQQPE